MKHAVASYCCLENCAQCEKMDCSDVYCTLSETSYQQSVTLARERHGIAETKHSEDPRLRNWYRWLKVRLEDQERVRRLTRGPGRQQLREFKDMVVNSGDDRRPLLEEKALMEEARYFYKPDRYRGDPAFWKPPWLLNDQGNPCLPECAAPDVRRQPRRFYGVPEAVQPRPAARSALSRWHQIEYRARRAEELKYELGQLAPHVPDIDGLYIKGNQVPLEAARAPFSSPSITVTPPAMGITATELDEDMGLLSPLKEEETEKKGAARLLFRGELLESTTRKQQESVPPLQFLLIFEAAVGHIDRKSVHVENVGDTAVRFSWVRVGGAGHAAARFCLESEGGGGPAVFLPGQLYDVRVAFKARRAGVFREVWCLRTTPQLPIVQLRLWGICRAATISVDVVERYLLHRMTEDAIRRLVLETKERMRLEPPPPMPLSTLCTEREVFLAANAGRGYSYRAEPVSEMVSLYRRIAPPGTQGCHLDVLHVRNTVLAVLTGQELEEALSIVYKCCEELREPVPQRTEAALGCSMVEAAVHATWAMVAEAVAQEADRLRNSWGIPLRPPGYFWQPPVTQPVTSRPSSRVTDKASIASRPKRSGKVVSPSASVLPSGSQESAHKIELDPGTERAYLAALYVCAYHHVATAVDWTSAIVESHNALTP